MFPIRSSNLAVLIGIARTIGLFLRVPWDRVKGGA
jgi:hypothetical protein